MRFLTRPRAPGQPVRAPPLRTTGSVERERVPPGAAVRSGPTHTDPAPVGYVVASATAAQLGFQLLAGQATEPLMMALAGVPGLGLALFPFLPIARASAPLGWIVVGTFLGGIGIEIFGVLWNTAPHTHVAPERLSRVSAYDVVGSIAIVAPTLLALLVPEVRTLGSVPDG